MVRAEVESVGPKSRRVRGRYDQILTRLGSEIDILDSLPLEDVEEASSSVVAEAIGRMRAGNVIRNAGYDGVYGTIRLFDPTELEQRNQEASFFEFLEAHDG